MLLFKAA